jgi:hypothetical protein
LAEWERQREEERKRQEEEQAKEDRMNIKAKREQQKDAEAAVRERWAQEEYLQNYAEHIERKMERIDAVEDAKWTTTVSAIQKRKEEEARQDRMNEHIEDKMAQVEAAESTSPANGKKDENPWSIVDGLVSFGLDVASFVQDDLPELVTNVPIIATTTRWLLSPSLDPNPTSAAIREEQLLLDARRGLINTQQLADGIADIAATSKPGPVNYTTLSTLFNTAKLALPSVGGLLSLGLQVTGMATGNEDMKNTGDVSGGVLGLGQGLAMGNSTLISEVMATTAGRLLIPVSGALGAIQYVTSSARLVTDEEINPVQNGQWDNTVWIDRVGVMTQGIGGAFLAAGALCAFIPGGQPVAAVLLPAGAAFLGAGSIMTNLDWVASKASDLGDSFVNWWNTLPTTPAAPEGIQTAPVATPTKTVVTSTPAAPNVALQQNAPTANTPQQEAPPPSTPSSTPER